MASLVHPATSTTGSAEQPEAYVIPRTERGAGTSEKPSPISRRDRPPRSGRTPIQEGSFIVYNAANRHRTTLNLADLEPLRDVALATRTGECPFLGRLSRGAGNLRRWLSRARDERRAHVQVEPLDDHTLSDIGIPRIETLYWDSK
jgi:uncharacterized protein YjiS (DUF1127 family)